MDIKTRTFELTMWPHLRSAYNLARWLMRDGSDAEDVVQESMLKAFKAMDTFRGGEARGWMLSIVRNTAMNYLRKRKTEMAGHDSLGQPSRPTVRPTPSRGCWCNRGATRFGRRLHVWSRSSAKP